MGCIKFNCPALIKKPSPWTLSRSTWREVHARTLFHWFASEHLFMVTHPVNPSVCSPRLFVPLPGIRLDWCVWPKGLGYVVEAKQPTPSPFVFTLCWLLYASIAQNCVREFELIRLPVSKLMTGWIEWIDHLPDVKYFGKLLYWISFSLSWGRS